MRRKDLLTDSLGLPDVHARNRSRDNKALDLAGTFKDRVNPRRVTISTGHGTFRRVIDPQMSGKDPVRTHLDRIPDPVGGSRTSAAVSREELVDHAKQNQSSPAKPPQNAFGRRSIDLAPNFGFGAFSELTKPYAGFAMRSLQYQ